MNKNAFGRAYSVLPVLSIVFTVFLASCAPGAASSTSLQVSNQSVAQQVSPQLQLLHGKTSALSWIFGRDCQRGVQAYLQSAAADPDLALVGTGWVDPTNGSLIVGNNNCEANIHSMDSVVQLAHSKGGMAYLTITMDTEGSGAWTYQQAAAYIDKATTNQGYIDAIVQETVRGNYDGVIMDLEGVDRGYPSIQQLFATYNQHLWAALQPLHKWYGIALIPKIGDNENVKYLNAFEDWHLLAHAADFIVIMAVDQSSHTPGPSVSLPWLKQLLAYAIQSMPNMLPNIIWELPLYGDSWHWENNDWVYDNQITYQDAQNIVQQLTPAQIDTSASDLQDIYEPHMVYTDTSGVKHSLWFPTPKSLYTIITGFWEALQEEPQFGNNRLQIAVWWRTTQEPHDFWPLLDTLYRS